MPHLSKSILQLLTVQQFLIQLSQGYETNVKSRLALNVMTQAETRIIETEGLQKWNTKLEKKKLNAWSGSQLEV